MLPYHNAVSDQLVVSLFPEFTVYLVYGKDHNLKWIHTTKEVEYPNVLANCIFSTSRLITAFQNFTLAPLGSVNYASFYELNFGNENVLATSNTEEFMEVYKPNERYPIVSKRLVSDLQHTDIELVYQYASQKSYKDALYFYTYDNKLTVMAWKEGKCFLANRFPADNLDEVFYYIMLVIEQLELPADSLHFESICSKGRHETYHSLFQKYVSPLYLSTLASSTSVAQEEKAKEAETLAQFFAQCVL